MSPYTIQQCTKNLDALRNDLSLALMIGAGKGVNTTMARSVRQQADINSFDSPLFILASAILD
jgi:hypothetical protein